MNYNIKRTLIIIVIILFITWMGYIAWDRFGIGESIIHAKLVSDNASILSDEEEANLAKYHAAILDSYDIDYRVVTDSEASNINKYSADNFAANEVGSLAKSGMGILLVINPKSDELRLEVGRSLEHIYTDSFVSFVEREQMVPFFRDNRVSVGVLATTELLVARIQEAIDKVEFDPENYRKAEVSTGAGAKTAANIGKGNIPIIPKRNISVLLNSNDSPEEVVGKYIDAMQNYNADPNLDIYTDATKNMMRNWRVTKGQMKNIVNTYKKCRVLDRKINGNLAVVRYPVNDRKCSPFFLMKENKLWKLDLTMMQTSIIFNHKNLWRFKNRDHKYMFAFSDWSFDRNGYPHSLKKYRWQLSVKSYDHHGAIITAIGKGSPAEEMGLKVGDRIMRWDGIEKPNYKQMLNNLTSVPEGKIINAYVYRNKKMIPISYAAPPKP